jgi:ABC-type nitrate/sulfonate/bicarbonate transport system substrate-binding protein
MGMRRLASVVLVLAAFLLVFSLSEALASGKTESAKPASTSGKPAIPDIPEVNVRAVQEPYYVCSASSIGLAKGWFKEVGITFGPESYGKIITGGETVQMIASKNMDMIDQPTMQVLGAIKNLPPVKVFVYDSIFWGSIVLGDQKYKSVEEFQKEGLQLNEAIKRAVSQIRGKKWGTSGSPGDMSFVKTVLDQGGLTVDDIEVNIYADPEITAMMLTKQIDFCGGMGLPAVMELISKGFKMIVTASQVAQSAKPSADSKELRTVFQVGWTSYDDYIAKNYDTVLRFSSVVWRQAAFIRENQAEAISIHLPFLNSASGARNTPEQIKQAYEIFDPFFGFDQQDKWFNDPSFPLYEDYVLGSYINSWVEDGYLTPGEVKPADISIARKVYTDMLKYKKSAGTAIEEAKALLQKASETKKGVAADVEQTGTLLKRAQAFYAGYNFFDASRFANAAKEWATFIQK